jgi:phosphoserine phosphatase
MSRLVVQHPQLSDETIHAIAGTIGRPPGQLSPGLAVWPGVLLDGDAATRLGKRHGVDAEVVPARLKLGDFRLAAFDMDSTLITIECVDEIADYAGRKAEVAAITDAAMRGEIADYDDSLRQRVALLAGLPETVLERVYDERLRLSDGVETLMPALRRAGLRTLLVSGGFTFFTQRLRERLSIDFAQANTLEVVDGRLTGRLQGEIVNADVKRRIVEQTCRQLGCSPAQALVVGDGANDLKMMSIAGLSVAFRAKPVVRSETTHAVDHCGLDSILNYFSER